MPIQSQTVAGPPLSQRARGTRWPSLFVVCIGVMMAFINASSTLSALPYIQADLHIPGSTLVWIPSAFTLAVVSLVMSAGTFGELYGRRSVHMIGLALFVVGSATSFLATSAGVLIAAQAVVGMGTAAILPTGLAIVSTTFHDPQERTGAISIWASTAGIGLAIGPLVGGVLLDHVSWQSVYLTNVVLGIIAVALASVFVREGKHPTRRLDPVGVALGTLTVAAATFAIIEGGAGGYGDPGVLVACAVAVIGAVTFVRVELRHPDPMLDLRLFRSASFTVVMLVGAAVMFGFVGIALLSVLYLDRVSGLGALETGVRLLPMMASYVVVTALAGHVVRRVGFRATFATGLVLMSIGSLALLRTAASGEYAGMWPGLLAVGVGSGLLVAPSTAAAVNGVRPDQAGMAAATVNLFRQLGSMLGPSILGTIATARFPTLLSDHLVIAGAPRTSADEVATDIGRGITDPVPPALASAVADAIPAALTSALHSGWLTAGIVLLLMAVPALLFVRHRSPVQ